VASSSSLIVFTAGLNFMKFQCSQLYLHGAVCDKRQNNTINDANVGYETVAETSIVQM